MKVMVGLSGGVDSAVAAYLLKKQGYDVVACFMRNWDAMANGDYLGNPTVNDDQCPQEKDYQDAQKVAEKLGIPLLRVDFIKEYWDHVFSFFISEYENGRTPNPDILCNKYIKFDAFLEFAKKNNCDMIAMGHYAKRVEKDGHFYLAKCFDTNKDQTYFLSQINEEQIKSCLFPLGDIDKTEVRRIAHELDLESVMDKKDSTGVCFIGERNFREFLKNYIPAQKGNIKDIDTGKIIGEHRGVYYYTIGQHKGLGIGGISGETAVGWFIVKKDAKKNILYVTRGDTQKYLMSNKCIVRKLNFINKDEIFPQKVGVKFRYRQPDHPAVIELVNGEIVCEYDYYKAVTPGQEAVFYNEEGLMIGSGTIDEVYRDNIRIDK
ncbi:MAG: tRNA 2-thiouridine(34) synthase MnmA [Firmicutes bacterium]|nr:tRNA 2-thiouridine(34) synthase MnmA [Candidatus Fiminaster equi]